MIPGLSLIEEFIGADREAQLTEWIDSKPWDDRLHRRVQQYGHRYDHRSRSLDESYLGPLPELLGGLARDLEPYFGKVPNQVIINEYLPGQGISKHIDCPRCFGPVVLSLSLQSGAMMRFDDHQPLDLRRRHELYLPRRSLLILKDEARYEWRHEIVKRRSDKLGDEERVRERRISVTLRRALERVSLRE